MGQKGCSYSVIKKPCPRKRFPCSRCGAKIVNGGLAWDVSVPKFKRWHYMDPATLVVNNPATEKAVNLILGTRLENLDPETEMDSPCKFGGSVATETARILSGTTPDNYDSFVADFERDRFIGDGNNSPWVLFKREHSAIVDWVQAEEENGELITPGRWRITLKITQAALIYVGVSPADKFGNYANGASFGDRLSLFVGDLVGAPYNHTDGDLSPALGVYDPVIITQEYFAPSHFECPALEDVFTWSRPLPTLPPLFPEFPITIDDLPAGYAWPANVSTHDEFGNPITYDREFFPEGFNSHDAYYAPPYIDVRHVKK